MSQSPSKMNNNEDGFSSDSQRQQELLQIKQQGWQQILAADQDITIKKKLQPPVQIQKQSYSLQPDMINGWAPKVQLIQPVPLTFNNYEFDSLMKSLSTKIKPESKLQLCFFGARYESTYYAWYDRDFQFPYKHMNPPKYIQITDRYFCGQHWDAESSQYLLFDSLYESGNLDCVFKVGQNQYDLFMRVDSNTRGHLHWFNFKVKNCVKGVSYKFNICNFQKGKSLYTRGMKPYIFSKQKKIQQDIGWHQVTGQAKFSKKVCKTYKQLSYEADSEYYNLRFKYTAEYSDDQIQFCYCIPYTYTFLQQSLKRWQQKASDKNIFHFKKLCNSLGGLDVPEVTITNNVEEEVEMMKKNMKINKKVVIITGRCHPGQSNGSWMTHGLIQFLCENNKISDFLRQNIIFKIFPMLNPDGVAMGNYRTGLSGKDFNRQFINPDKLIFPEIYNLKQVVWKYKDLYKEAASIYLDLHGHSVKKNVFAYGPEFPIIHKYYYECRLLPKLFSAKTQMFRYYSCIFKISQSKQSTARAVIIRNFKIPFTYTIQASNGSFYNQDSLQNFDFCEEKWKKMGQKLIQGLYDYFIMILSLERYRKQKMEERKRLIEKARNKKISKKISSYATTSNFYKRNQTDRQYSLSEILASSSSKDKNLQNLFNELKLQNEENKQEKAVSDDQISEGSSDSQGSKDDLDQDSMDKLLNAIKKKNGKQTLRSKIKKLKNKSSSVRIKTMYAENDKKEVTINDEEMKIFRPSETKQITIRKFLKKKNSLGSGISPKKQESSLPTKIVTFNFDVKPIDHSFRKLKTNNQEIKEDKLQIGYMSQTNEKIKRPVTRSIEYSDTFKKTFLSVQKQIIRRDTHKRQLVILNHQNHKNVKKSNSMVDNIQGKKIKFG